MASIIYTYVARVTDGLMLVASIDGHNIADDQLKADGKQIIRSLSFNSSRQCTFESGNVAYHYLIEGNVCYLVLCDKSYPKRLAFLYLSDMHNRFIDFLIEKYGPTHWEQQLNTVAVPYPHIQFDKQIQRLRKDYSNPNSQQSTNKLNSDIIDVTTIMKRNIQDVIDRGQRLETTQEHSAKMLADSKKFEFGAKKLNRMAFWRKWAPILGGVSMIVLFLFFRFYLL